MSKHEPLHLFRYLSVRPYILCDMPFRYQTLLCDCTLSVGTLPLLRLWASRLLAVLLCFAILLFQKDLPGDALAIAGSSTQPLLLSAELKPASDYSARLATGNANLIASSTAELAGAQLL